ncbi:MAG: hypothetical protein PUD22_04295 [Erysipelotrichaceae bacterium]|nr:hypothetical protein [Erysipelotrichaceae bacterium]
MNLQELYAKIGDYDEALRKLANERVINRCVIRFLSEPTFTRLMDAYERKDLYGIYQNSFTLTSIASGMCLGNLSNLSYRIKIAYTDYGQALIQGKDPSSVSYPNEEESARMFEELKKEYHLIVDNIEKYLRFATNNSLRNDINADDAGAIVSELEKMLETNKHAIEQLNRENSQLAKLIEKLG